MPPRVAWPNATLIGFGALGALIWFDYGKAGDLDHKAIALALSWSFLQAASTLAQLLFIRSDVSVFPGMFNQTP